MNVLLWVLQVALAVLSLAGGAYKVFGFDALERHLDRVDPKPQRKGTRR